MNQFWELCVTTDRLTDDTEFIGPSRLKRGSKKNNNQKYSNQNKQNKTKNHKKMAFMQTLCKIYKKKSNEPILSNNTQLSNCSIHFCSFLGAKRHFSRKMTSYDNASLCKKYIYIFEWFKRYRNLKNQAIWLV